MSIDISPHRAVFGITGWKNSGKTTLVSELVTWFTEQGLKVSTIKHAHCNFDIDKPGTDSYKHREAGAQQVLLASSSRWALMNELRQDREPELQDLLPQLAPTDLVLVEGFKMGDQPKIQVVRPANNTERLSQEAQPIVAVASDETIDPADYGCDGPLLPLNDIAAIGRFIADYCGLTLPNS
ncbi:molybdopterin-guanine dinucleotide biosynthesis protein B [Pseudomaricurvus alkylphenolicus]|jgi:molybdopterin-guanine dinucleotide biosynthesis protein MobB|uniref:molybdopterin-guanine dinucleotide biosynthesis protein B n=1 Tax=Pseudomaricurvus alkylphenolicus TaxID=1306991 RepID=UPI00141E85EA|nr:molybdopterin-guanine dinucleotide biosynthesis protein B [Pseudomaricurvus alkylphenolicus]NIB41484.1 molybdopterin-guanine dinucleotide biosynthesis protein B [Pseudomaricurvus alkylphenolicus]